MSIAASRLESESEHESIGAILACLAGHRYADAIGLISEALSEGTRLARWNDPEILLLVAELEGITAELAETEAEQAELEHLVARFQAAHNKSLGARIAKLLKLRMRLLERLLGSDPEKKSAFEDAKRDYEQFNEEREAQKEEDARTGWTLTEEEQRELKQLFRRAAKKCHPDVVAPEHREAAAKMFRELKNAYDEGDLKRLRLLAERAEAGIFEEVGLDADTDENRKRRLRVQIELVLEALVKARARLQAVQGSATYRTMTEHDDWPTLFANQATVLDQEIEKLTGELGSDDDE